MARMYKKAVEIINGVTVTVADDQVQVQGPKGSLSLALPRSTEVQVDGPQLFVHPRMKQKKRSDLAIHGTIRQLIQNMITGVVEGYTKRLEIVGTGYRASTAGKELTLIVGYSHPVIFSIPEGVEVTVEKNSITVQGIDKQLVGEVAAQIRKVRKPEPYKGIGIRYSDEQVRRKAGKQAKGVG